MDSVEFVKAIRFQVIERDNQKYKELLDHTKMAKDPVWNFALQFYNEMDPSQREPFLKFLRLIQVNTVSHILGILDGTIPIQGSKDVPVLIIEPERKEPINEFLQDIFWEIEGVV